MLNRFIDEYKNELAITGAATTSIPFWFRSLTESLVQRGNYFYPGKFQMPRNLVSVLLHSEQASFASRIKLGMRNHYKGISSVYLLTGLYPYCTRASKILINHIDSKNQNGATEIVATGIVGASTAIATTPWETVRMVAMHKNKLVQNSLFKACNKIRREHGILVFWNGFKTMSLRNGIYASCYLGMPENIEKMIDANIPGTGTFHYLSTLALATLVPSAIFTCALAPFDMFYIHKQAAVAENNFTSPFRFNVFTSPFRFNVFTSNAYQTHGWKSFLPGTRSRFISAWREGFALTLFNQVCQRKLEKMINETHVPSGKKLGG